MATLGAVYSTDCFPRTPEEVVESLFRNPQTSRDTRRRPRPKHKRVQALFNLPNDENLLRAAPAIFGWMADEIASAIPTARNKLCASWTARLRCGKTVITNGIPPKSAWTFSICYTSRRDFGQQLTSFIAWTAVTRSGSSENTSQRYCAAKCVPRAWIKTPRNPPRSISEETKNARNDLQLLSKEWAPRAVRRISEARISDYQRGYRGSMSQRSKRPSRTDGDDVDHQWSHRNALEHSPRFVKAASVLGTRCLTLCWQSAYDV